MVRERKRPTRQLQRMEYQATVTTDGIGVQRKEMGHWSRQASPAAAHGFEAFVWPPPTTAQKKDQKTTEKTRAKVEG